MFEIPFSKPPVGGQPSERSFDDPPVFDRDERVSGRVLDDHDLQPEPFGSLGEASVAGIGADDAEHRVRQAGFSEELVAAGDVGDVRGGDEHGDEETETVNDDMAFFGL